MHTKHIYVILDLFFKHSLLIWEARQEFWVRAAKDLFLPNSNENTGLILKFNPSKNLEINQKAYKKSEKSLCKKTKS